MLDITQISMGSISPQSLSRRRMSHHAVSFSMIYESVDCDGSWTLCMRLRTCRSTFQFPHYPYGPALGNVCELRARVVGSSHVWNSHETQRLHALSISRQTKFLCYGRSYVVMLAAVAQHARTRHPQLLSLLVCRILGREAPVAKTSTRFRATTTTY